MRERSLLKGVELLCPFFFERNWRVICESSSVEKKRNSGEILKGIRSSSFSLKERAEAIPKM